MSRFPQKSQRRYYILVFAVEPVRTKISRRSQDNITFEQASTIPLALATAAEGLYGNANRAETYANRLTPSPWEAGGEVPSKVLVY